MKLYDEIIKKSQNLLAKEERRVLPLGKTDWKEISDRSMILRSDMAFELGGGNLPAIGTTIVTANKELVPTDGITLIGKDIPEIEKDTPYARIAVVRVADATLGEGEALYKTIRNLEYTRYHFYPEGFMMRVSASKQKECVRIGRDARKKGLNFTKTGNQMIEAFKKNELVEAVQMYYVTSETFDYKALENLMKETEKITKTIDHIMNNVIMDCHACSLQKVCDEVEGLRNLHFAK